jgi:pSer/pThr/pTyr-binding forkhead associated (FHA) protein
MAASAPVAATVWPVAAAAPTIDLGATAVIQPSQLPTLQMPARALAFLQVVGTEGARYPIRQRLIIGRSPHVDITVSDDKASRQHAEVYLREGRAVLRDLQSLNGTMVNGRRVTVDYPLHDGDVLTIGDTAFVYRNEAVD